MSDDIDAAIAKLEELVWIGEHAAEIMAPAIEVVARKQWAEGRYPTGGKWAVVKKTGAVALTSVTAKNTVEGKGRTLTVRGPDLLDFHVRTRRSIPEQGNGLPGPWLRAGEKALKERIDSLGR